MVDGKIISDHKGIAQEFNNFFSNIGKTISESVKPVEKSPESYLDDYDQNKPYFNLGNVGPIHLTDVIKAFESKDSPDLDGLSVKILKFIAIEISVPLAHIFNLSLTSGIFPCKLKTSRIVPIFKAGDPKGQIM